MFTIWVVSTLEANFTITQYIYATNLRMYSLHLYNVCVCVCHISSPGAAPLLTATVNPFTHPTLQRQEGPGVRPALAWGSRNMQQRIQRQAVGYSGAKHRRLCGRREPASPRKKLTSPSPHSPPTPPSRPGDPLCAGACGEGPPDRNKNLSGSDSASLRNPPRPHSVAPSLSGRQVWA